MLADALNQVDEHKEMVAELEGRLKGEQVPYRFMPCLCRAYAVCVPCACLAFAVLDSKQP